jgi:hypothetical protein
MSKDFFTKNNFTKFLESHGHSLDQTINIPMHCKLNVDPNDFFTFMYENWNESNTQPYQASPYYTEITNEQMALAREVGYHNGNLFKRDWGRLEKHNSTLKEIIGKNNFTKMGIDEKHTLVRILCYEPGNLFPVHWDEYETWWKKFGTDKTPTRFSVLINPWSWGQYLQLHTTVITNWQPGDCYIIPHNVLHCSGNGGIVPKVTLTITSLYE